MNENQCPLVDGATLSVLYIIEQAKNKWRGKMEKKRIFNQTILHKFYGILQFFYSYTLAVRSINCKHISPRAF